MAFHKSDNAETLRALDRDAVIRLIQKHSVADIAELFGVSYSVSRDVVGVALDAADIGFKNYDKITSGFIIHPTAEVYSENEMDYGYVNRKRTIRVKKGVLSVSEIGSPRKNLLQTVIEDYKLNVLNKDE